MRQDQLFDVGIRGDGSDDGRGHMEAPFQSGGVLGYGVMSDEYVRIGCQLYQAFSVSVCVSTENDSLAAYLDSPCQCGKWTVNDTHCVQRHVGVAKNEERR